jgi:protein N-terminal amidase
MCLSGYMFDTLEEIKPYLEPQGTGPTAIVAKQLATRLKCHVIAGYPEAAPEQTEGNKIGWNSVIVVDPSGEVVGNTRKTLLDDKTDQIWALEGTSMHELVFAN